VITKYSQSVYQVTEIMILYWNLAMGDVPRPRNTNDKMGWWDLQVTPSIKSRCLCILEKIRYSYRKGGMMMVREKGKVVYCLCM
jgi:hypothetical protein